MTQTTPRIKVGLGYTRNMGNFESLRVDVGVEADKTDNETMDQAFNRVYEFVETRLIDKVNEAENEIKNAEEKTK